MNIHSIEERLRRLERHVLDVERAPLDLAEEEEAEDFDLDLVYPYDYEAASPEVADQAMVRILRRALALQKTGPLFEGEMPLQIVTGRTQEVWAVSIDAGRTTLRTWRSRNAGRKFHEVDSIAANSGSLAIDARGRIWRLAATNSFVDAVLHRSNNGSSWEEIATFPGYTVWFATNPRKVACHPTKKNRVAISLTNLGFTAHQIYTSTDDGGSFTAVTLPASSAVPGGPEVMFTRKGTLLAGRVYEDTPDVISHHDILRFDSDLATFTTIPLTFSATVFAVGNILLTQAKAPDRTLYAIVLVNEQTSEEVVIADGYPFGERGHDSDGFGDEDQVSEEAGPAVFAFQSKDDGATWSEIDTPWHIPLEAWGDVNLATGNFQYNLYFPGTPSGIIHDGARLLVFFMPRETDFLRDYEDEINIIIGTGDGFTPGVYSLSVGSQDYTITIFVDDISGETLMSWEPGTPETHPPSGYIGTLLGNNPEAGYNAWYILTPEETFKLADFSPISVEQSGFFLDHTNAEETPYNGRAVGRVRPYGPGPGTSIDAAKQTDSTFIRGLIDLNDNAPGASPLGYLWAYQGGWQDIYLRLESASRITDGVAPVGAVSVRRAER